MLAEATALWEDSNPGRLYGADKAEEELNALLERHAKVRMSLLMLATSHPSGKGRELAGSVAFLLVTTLRATSGAVRAQGEDQERMWLTARGFYGQVEDKLGELIHRVQQS